MINFNSKVTLHFAVLLDGQEIDSTFERQPACFVMGDGSLLPGFEKRLLGLKSNDQREFDIPASEGFGERQQANIQRVRRSEFGSELPLQAGLLIGFVQPGGQEVPGLVLGFDDNEVEIDFNHPLAGRELTFKVQVLDVQNAAGQEAR